MEAIATRGNVKKLTAFRLNADWSPVSRFWQKKDNRSLNNYVENVLMSVAYNEPNETTKAALKEAEESKNLEEFDLDAFKKYVASL